MSAPAAGEVFRRIARRYFRVALFFLALGLVLGDFEKRGETSDLVARLIAAQE